jgi:hypothetical protein
MSMTTITTHSNLWVPKISSGHAEQAFRVT